MGEVYHADTSLKGKLRRRVARLLHRKPAGSPPRGMVTFSFDDAPASAATIGAALLEKHGVRGAYYISAGLMGADSHMGPMANEAQVVALHAAGHEIGCHTLSHIDCGVSPEADIAANVEANRIMLTSAGLPEPISFAFPYGDVSPAAKRALGGRSTSLRGLHHGLIEAGTDLNQLPAIGIEGEDGEAVARRWLEQARDRKAWVILYTHDVQDNPTAYGCTPGALERLIKAAIAMDLKVVTAAEGVASLSARRPADLARPA